MLSSFGFRGGFHFGEDSLTSASSDLDAFDAIYVDADMIDLSIETGNNYYLHSEYTDSIKFEYEVKDSALYIKQKTPKMKPSPKSKAANIMKSAANDTADCNNCKDCHPYIFLHTHNFLLKLKLLSCTLPNRTNQLLHHCGNHPYNPCDMPVKAQKAPAKIDASHRRPVDGHQLRYFVILVAYLFL